MINCTAKDCKSEACFTLATPGRPPRPYCANCGVSEMNVATLLGVTLVRGFLDEPELEYRPRLELGDDLDALAQRGDDR